MSGFFNAAIGVFAVCFVAAEVIAVCIALWLVVFLSARDWLRGRKSRRG
jgi:hypothetical protein